MKNYEWGPFEHSKNYFCLVGFFVTSKIVSRLALYPYGVIGTSDGYKIVYSKSVLFLCQILSPNLLTICLKPFAAKSTVYENLKQWEVIKNETIKSEQNKLNFMYCKLIYFK